MIRLAYNAMSAEIRKTTSPLPELNVFIIHNILVAADRNVVT